MAVMDEFKKERETVKTGTKKDKLSYFWDYYKWHTIIALFIIISGINMTYRLLTAKDIALSGMLLNTYIDNMEQKDSIINDFMAVKNIDESEYRIDLNTSYNFSVENDTDVAASNDAVNQAVKARSTNQLLDFMSSDLTTMVDFAYRGWFVDLTTVLSEDQLAIYEPYFFYIDQAVLNQMKEATNNLEDASLIPIPDSSKPESMQDPIPVLIDLTLCDNFSELYTYKPDTLVIGIIYNSPRKDMALNFVEYLMK